MKKIILTGLLLSSFVVFSQEKQLPEGWDSVMLNGKPAYMNIITGEISTKKPTKPAKKPTIAVEVDPSINHKVKKGETLFSIAKKYGITVDDIYKMNAELTPEKLKEGDEIKVGYDKTKEGKVEYKVVEDMYTNPSNNSQHYVKKGETLYSISRKHGLSVKKLKELNGLTSDRINEGQKLILQK